jgi:hypothetical protein
VDGLEIRVTSVTIAAPDPLALADFYARLLGRPDTEKDGPRPGEPPNAGWAQIRRPEDGPQHGCVRVGIVHPQPGSARHGEAFRREPVEAGGLLPRWEPAQRGGQVGTA